MISITRKPGEGFYVGGAFYRVFSTDPHRAQIITPSGMATIQKLGTMPIDGGDIRLTHVTPRRCQLAIDAPGQTVLRAELMERTR